MDNLIPTATIILAEASVVLLVLLAILGVRYVRRNRQHRREIETLMDMARDSRVSLPGPKVVASTPATASTDGGNAPSASAPVQAVAGAGTDGGSAMSEALVRATAADPLPKDATEHTQAAQNGAPARTPITSAEESTAARASDREPAPAPARDPAESAIGAAPIMKTDGQEVETLRQAVAALEGKVLQAHRDQVRLAARMQRAMDRMTDDVAAARRDLAELAERLLDGHAREPYAAPPESRGEDSFVAGGGEAPAAVSITNEPSEPTAPALATPPPMPEAPAQSDPALATPGLPEAPAQLDPAPATPPLPETPAPDFAGPAGEESVDIDPRRIHAAGASGKGEPLGRAEAAGAEPAEAEDPDYILDSETIERLLGADGMAASAQDSGIDVEEISLSESGPQWNPAPAHPRQPFASQQDNIFFQSSTAGGLEQGWYISLAGEPPQGPFSDKQTAERVLHEVRGHTAGRSARSG